MQKSYEERSIDSALATINIFDADHWRLWHYECTDWPDHNTSSHIYIGKSKSPKSCYFCNEVNSIRPKDAVIESSEKWMKDYMKRGRLLPSDPEKLLNMLKSESEANQQKPLFPTQMAPMISFNKKVGMALFRDEVPPDYDHALNSDRWNYQMLVLVKGGNIEAWQKMDSIFRATLEIVSDEGLRPSLANAINGIFLRCEVNPGKWLANQPDAYVDHRNLPCMFKLELWVRNNVDKAEMEAEVIDKIGEEANKAFPKQIGQQQDVHWEIKCLKVKVKK